MGLIRSLGNATIRRKIAAIAIIPAAAVCVVSATPAFASPAHSAAADSAHPAANYYPSIVYTQPGRPKAEASCVQGCGNYGLIYPNNDNAVHMVCYYDASSSTDGNYSSNVWFDVYLNGWPGEWFIHSSYIYYQTTVPPC